VHVHLRELNPGLVFQKYLYVKWSHGFVDLVGYVMVYDTKVYIYTRVKVSGAWAIEISVVAQISKISMAGAPTLKTLFAKLWLAFSWRIVGKSNQRFAQARKQLIFFIPRQKNDRALNHPTLQCTQWHVFYSIFIRR
jgi:hypothetical protein